MSGAGGGARPQCLILMCGPVETQSHRPPEWDRLSCVPWPVIKVWSQEMLWNFLVFFIASNGLFSYSITLFSRRLCLLESVGWEGQFSTSQVVVSIYNDLQVLWGRNSLELLVVGPTEHSAHILWLALEVKDPFLLSKKMIKNFIIHQLLLWV